MDVVFLSRLQFGFNITFHYLFPPMTIGLAWLLIIMEGFWVWTKRAAYRHMVQFWTKIFSLFFAMGVATGFIQVFAFGNNWSEFSKFVGDVFGTLLAAEGIFAFFLEAGFLGVMLFGWDKVKPWFHYLSTILVAVGATFSAIWIVMANSWMQTPAGFKIIGEGVKQRAVITNLYEVYFNPSFLNRVGHVLLGCGLMGVFLVVSVSAYYILKKKHREFSFFSLKLSLIVGMFFLLLQLISGDESAKIAAKYQPEKFAAMEAVFETQTRAPFVILGWIDNEEFKGISIPGFLSWITYFDANRAIAGLHSFPKEDWPWVPGVFYSFHVMVYAWGLMMLITIVGLIQWKRKKLEQSKWFLWPAVLSIILPYAANIAGWFTAELGRQPWIVYKVMRTAAGASKVVTSGQVLGSLVMFVVISGMIGALFVFLLNQKIQDGPGREDGEYRKQGQQL